MADKNQFWQDRRVLITGATGLLGSSLTKQLHSLHADVVCLVRDWVPQSELVRSRVLEKVTVVRGDMQDRELLERALAEYEIETVFNLAAQTTVPVANRNPISTLETNVRGTWNMLEACRRSPTVGQIIHASSDKAYGDQERLPYTEDLPLRGSHPYDVSKSCADLIARSYAVTFGLAISITRCGNLFGGGDLNWNRIVPGTIRSVLRGHQPVIRSDGLYVRDYFYIEDAVAANLVLAEQLSQSAALRGEAFNFSYERPMNVLDIVALILHLMMRPDMKPVVRNEATGEIRDQYLSASKARQLLNWKPALTLEEGMRCTIEWYRALLGER